MRSTATGFVPARATTPVPKVKVDEFASYFKDKCEHMKFKSASTAFIEKVRGGSLDLTKKANLELASTVIKTGHQPGRNMVFQVAEPLMAANPEIGQELGDMLLRSQQLDPGMAPLLEITKQLSSQSFLNPKMLKGALQAACNESQAGKSLATDLGDKYLGSEGGAPRAGDLQHVLGNYQVVNGALIKRIVHEITAPSIVLTDPDGSQGPRFAEDGLALEREQGLRNICSKMAIKKFYQTTRNGDEALITYPGMVVNSVLDFYLDVDLRSSAGQALFRSYTQVLRQALAKPMADYCAEPRPKNPVSVILTGRHGLGRALITSSDRSILDLLCFDSIPPGF